MPPTRAVIIANGDLGDLNFYRHLLKKDNYIICVNGGTAHAFSIGLTPNLVIGDLDSIQAEHIQDLERSKTRIIRYPSEKDQSDLELAIDYALRLDPFEILIIGALGGARIDHGFINLLLLEKPLRHNVHARIVDESREVQLIGSSAVIDGKEGDNLSLFSLTAETSGIVTEGLKYPLEKETLYFASTRGLSNLLNAPQVRISIDSGLLIAIKTSS